MPIHFTNGNCHIKQLKSGKSHTICLTNHTRSTSHHITLVINGLGADTQTDTQTHTHTHVQSKAISRNQVCSNLWSASALFKNIY